MISFAPEQLFLVTGASSGIGYATALLVNRLGGSIIANGRNGAGLAQLKEEAKYPDRIHMEQRDLIQEMDSLPSWVTGLRKKYGKFSGFAHCAGHNLMSPFMNFNSSDASQIFEIHYTAGLLLARGISDRRNHDKSCSIVFMGSISAVFPLRMMNIYAAAKGAVITAAGCLSKDLATQGVRVNSISPALVRTPMTEHYSSEVMGFDVVGKEDGNYPLGVAEPMDIANMIAFLFSDASRKITGQNFVIDGGRF